MMENLKSEILDAIDKSLPAAVGDQLRKRLEQASRLESEIETTKRLAKVDSDRVVELRVELDKYHKWQADLEKREKAIVAREEEVFKKELDFLVADIRVKAANDKANSIFDLAKIAFGHRIHREVMHESVSREVPVVESGGYCSTRHVTESKTVERVLE